MSREQFITEIEMLVIQSMDPNYDRWHQSLDVEKLRRRASLFYDRVLSRTKITL
jgi:hypothetical protein